MKNMTLKVEKNIMTITIDLKKDCGMSKSGKNKMIAKTEGTEVHDGHSVNLQVYKKT